MTEADMWMVYVDTEDKRHYQHWKDIASVGALIDPYSGDDMQLIGWTASDPY